MAFRFVIARRPEADVAISGRHLQFVQAAVKMVRTDCVCSGAQGAPCSLAIFAAHILRRKAPKFVIARREAPLALPLGELSPKVTERALQALPISTGHCSNDTHLRLVIPRSEATWESRRTRLDHMVLPAKTQLPSRDCHVGRWPPRNDNSKPLHFRRCCPITYQPARRSLPARGTPHP